MFRFHPSPKPVGKRAMTLVEVMMAFAVFAIAVVGGLGAIIFSLNNVDSARTEAQVTQILVHEMESMRLRSWGNSSTPKDPNGRATIYAMSHSAGTPVTPSLSGDLTLAQDSLNKYQVAGGTLDGVPLTLRKVEFTPFAAYGANDAITVPVSFKSRNVSSYICERYIGGFSTAASTGIANNPANPTDAAVIILLVRWTDNRGNHARAISTILVSNGLINQ